jgi:uncharacterized protein YodC (DUF2158 family)
MFDIGTIVNLNSGGPDMTVERVYENSAMRCVWFDGGLLREADFRPGTVTVKTKELVLCNKTPSPMTAISRFSAR